MRGKGMEMATKTWELLISEVDVGPKELFYLGQISSGVGRYIPIVYIRSRRT